MSKFIDPIGQSCSHADAHINGRLRPGYRAIMGDGERVSFDLSMMDSRNAKGIFIQDAKASELPKSIDEAVKQAIEAAAIARSQKPSEYLTSLNARQLEELAQSAAATFMRSAVAQGMVKSFNLDGSQNLRNALARKETIDAGEALLGQARSLIGTARIQAQPEKAWRQDASIRAGAEVSRALSSARYA